MLIGVRRVEQDLLDILLIAETFHSKKSLLSEIASLQKMPLTLLNIAISRRQARSMLIRHVKTLEARLYAMAIVDSLMFASARINNLQLHSTAYDMRSIRTHWQWTLISPESLNLLAARSKNWPLSYVKRSWPELLNIENVPMLQRKRRLIILCATHHRPAPIHYPLANIRAN